MPERSDPDQNASPRIQARALVIVDANSPALQRLLAALDEDAKALILTGDGRLQAFSHDQTSVIPVSGMMVEVNGCRLKIESVAGHAPLVTDQPAWVEPELVVTTPLDESGAVRTTRHRVPAGEGRVFSIGRSRTGNDLVLQDPHVSSHHLKFERTGQTTLVSDLSSRWGTKVNGQPLKAMAPLTLKHLDVIVIGGTTIRFEHPWSTIRPATTNTMLESIAPGFAPAAPPAVAPEHAAQSNIDAALKAMEQPEPPPQPKRPSLESPGLAESSASADVDGKVATDSRAALAWIVLVACVLIATVAAFGYFVFFQSHPAATTLPTR